MAQLSCGVAPRSRIKHTLNFSGPSHSFNFSLFWVYYNWTKKNLRVLQLYIVVDAGQKTIWFLFFQKLHMDDMLWATGKSTFWEQRSWNKRTINNLYLYSYSYLSQNIKLCIYADLENSFSNRCFWTKAISIWTSTGDADHAWIIGSYFHYAGGFQSPVVCILNFDFNKVYKFCFFSNNSHNNFDFALLYLKICVCLHSSDWCYY